ncbi:MAG: hypothetical protein HC936_03325 [Leptolyngbyaceae cyanobacterium SU_3_3]|nr:hypothetical protein [Leptolyngbyaceae cyanobacterium SU_3_3]NJR49672.1 hypothetical protein [Leptolyngbyaceae cyanobacterium CSU_1_3]
MSRHFTRNRLSRASWRIQSAIALGLMTFVISACETEQRAVIAPISPSPTLPATPSPTSPATILPSPATNPLTELVGQNVTVSTKVQRVITPNLFTVYDVESLRGQTVLVVSKNQAPAIGTNIELTGVVRDFVVADVEKEYGIDVTPEVGQEFVNKPYVAAAALEKVD